MAVTDATDIPLDYQTGVEEGSQDLPLEFTPINPKPEAIKNLHRGQAAILKSELEDKDIFQSYLEVEQEEDPSSLLNQYSVDRSEMWKEEFRQHFNKAVRDSRVPEEAVEHINTYEALLEEEELAARRPERQVVESLSDPSATEEEKRSIEAEMLVVNTLSNIINNYTTFEKGLDLAKTFVGNDLFDNIQMTGSVFSAFEADDFMRDVVVGMKDLKRNDPEKFQEVFPIFMETLQEKLGKGKQLSVLASIIDARGEEDVQQSFSDLNAAFSAVDIASLGAWSALKIGRLTQRLNAIRMAAKLKNIEAAADVNAAALADDTGSVAKAAGVEKETAYANGSPFNVEGLDPAYAQGLSTETLKRIKEVKDNQKRVSDYIRSEDGLLREDLLTPAERSAAEDAFLSNLKEQGIENVQVLTRGRDSTAFQYEIVPEVKAQEGILDGLETGVAEVFYKGTDPKGFLKSLKDRGYKDAEYIDMGEDGYAFYYNMKGDKEAALKFDEASLPGGEIKTERLDLTLDHKTGVWTKTEQGTMFSFLASPTVFAKNAIEDVKAALRMDSTSAHLGNMLRDLQREALSPIIGKKGIKGLTPSARASIAKIDDVLLSGDSFVDSASGVRGRVYTADELRGGVNGQKLTEEEIETYYNLRSLYDELWTIRNDETRRSMVSQGKKEIKIGTDPHIGKSYDKKQAVAVVNAEGKFRVYNADTKEVVEVSGKDLSELYDQGMVLNKLDNPIYPEAFDGAEGMFDLVLTKPVNVGDLPQKVLHFRKGYVPKVNKNARWFVKERGEEVVNGKTREVDKKTLRMFASQKQAEDWMRTQGNKKMVLREDREVERQVLGSSGQGSGGGLYTGPRSQEVIPFGPEGTPPERLNTMEALSMNLQSLENFVTRNQWRMAMRQKWINSVKAAGYDIDRFEPALIPEKDSHGKGLRRLAEQINIWSGFPTKGELWWDGFVSGTMEWALNRPNWFKGKSDKVVVSGANYLRNSGDPVTKMRGLAFHSLLGWFNPAQLWVQAQGATVAASLATKLTDPLAGLRLLKNQTALAFASKFDDPETIQHIAKVSALDPEELTKIVRYWKRTGLEDSVLNTADHAAALAGYGITKDALKRTADSGLFFYKGGELVNRRFSFLAALERKREQLGHLDLTDNDLKEVLTRANDTMLNLSKSNRAAWQRGVMAMPTQFWQVQAKMVESLLGFNKDFTGAERLKIAIGQIALYGAAGIPLGNLGVRWAMETMGITQAEVEEMDPKLVKAINEGFWGWYVLAAMGADNDIASRGAIAEGLMQTTVDTLFSERSLVEKFFAASGQAPLRFWKAWEQIKPMAPAAGFHGAELTDQEILSAVNALASITSTWSNARKAWMMHRLGILLDSRGSVVDSRDFDLHTEAMTLFGFQPSELKRVRDREQLVRGVREERSHVVDTMINVYWTYVQNYNAAESDKERDQIVANFHTVNRLIASTVKNEGDIKKVLEMYRERLERGETRKERAIRDFIEEFVDRQADEVSITARNMTASGLIQNEIYQEQ